VKRLIQNSEDKGWLPNLRTSLSLVVLKLLMMDCHVFIPLQQAKYLKKMYPVLRQAA